MTMAQHSDRSQGIPEESEQALKRLDESVLRVGDVVLTTTTAFISKAIRAKTNSDISHAMICVDTGSVIDATGEGVQARNTQRLYFEKECSVYVLRMKGGLSGDQIRAICGHARSQVGVQYSTWEAFKTILGGSRNWTTKQFCSRLVAQAFASGGIKLVDDANFCSPADIKNCPLLLEVSDATVPVTAEELAVWDGMEDVPQMMRDAINFVLDGARKRNKDIQSFDDLHRHLLEHREDDRYLCDLLNASGYLDVWRVGMEQATWQYDLALMQQAPDERVRDYCWDLLASEEMGPNRYIANRGGYVSMAKQTGLAFFIQMAELYTHLSMLHRTRVEVATKWLQDKRLLPASVQSSLEPHSEEWFAALELWDPTQAAMSRIAIESAGTPNCCSICGDDPARDYRLEESHRPAGGVDTLRLCDDCLGTRKGMGEPYVPLDAATN